MSTFELNDFIEELESPHSYAPAKSYGGGNALEGVSITYNKNGKRLSITNALANRLNIDKSLSISLIKNKRLIIIGRDFDGGTKYKCSPTSTKPIIYKASLVEGIVHAFGLQDIYKSGRTSISFHDISFDGNSGVAFVKIPEPEQLS